MRIFKKKSSQDEPEGRRARSSTERASAWLVAATAIFALIAIGCLVLAIYFSAIRDLSQLEVTLLSALSFVFQIILGACVGLIVARESARREYRGFVGSAVRRTFGVVGGLQRVLENIKQGARRMIGRRGLGDEARTQLWIEQLNLIGCQLNELLRQTEESVDDWREIAWEVIEEEEKQQQQRLEKMAALTKDLADIYHISDDLAVVPGQSDRALMKLEALAEELETELVTLRGSTYPIGVTAAVEKGEARKLLMQGAFEEAVEVYSRMIQLNPQMHTLYIGRARARYLAGDTAGALSDVKQAQELSPEDPAIARVKDQLERGQGMPSAGVADGPPPYLEKAFSGNQALAEGDADAAEECYKAAAEQGLFPAFVAMNLAMVDILRGRGEEALKHLTSVNLKLAGRFMQVQVVSLQLIAESLVAGEKKPTNRLTEALEACGVFELSRSPLRFLREGLTKRGDLDATSVAVFRELEAASAKTQKPMDTAEAGDSSPSEGGD